MRKHRRIGLDDAVYGWVPNKTVYLMDSSLISGDAWRKLK